MASLEDDGVSSKIPLLYGAKYHVKIVLISFVFDLRVVFLPVPYHLETVQNMQTWKQLREEGALWSLWAHVGRSPPPSVEPCGPKACKAHIKRRDLSL